MRIKEPMGDAPIDRYFREYGKKMKAEGIAEGEEIIKNQYTKAMIEIGIPMKVINAVTKRAEEKKQKI